MGKLTCVKWAPFWLSHSCLLNTDLTVLHSQALRDFSMHISCVLYILKYFLRRLREFDSGVMVLQSSNHSEDKVIKNTAALVNLSFVNPLLFLLAWQTKTNSFAKRVDPEEMACKNRLIRIYTVCYSVFDFRLKLLLASVDKSKNGSVHFRNSGMKGLIEQHPVKMEVSAWLSG